MDARLALATLAGVCALAGPLAIAQDTPPASPPEADAPAPLPPPPEIGPAVEPPPKIAKPKVDAVARLPSPPPPAVLRGPVAVLQVLDKITAETLRFEAPVGRRVRYKTLVVEVKACETRGYADPEPRPSAYLVVETKSPPTRDPDGPKTEEVFHGWTFADTPALHGLEHPIYDLWLVACSAATPVS